MRVTEVFFHFWVEARTRGPGQKTPPEVIPRKNLAVWNEEGRESVSNRVRDRCSGIETADRRQSTGRHSGNIRKLGDGRKAPWGPGPWHTTCS